MPIDKDLIKRLAATSGHHPDDVERDIPILARMRNDKIWAINKFFIKGDPWFHTQLEGFQEGVITRIDSSVPLNCEVLPRGHTKTTMLRAWSVLRSGLGQSPYRVQYSYSDSGWEGNLEALKLVLESTDFLPLQWMFEYIHGPDIAQIVGNQVYWGNGHITEFKSILGESRGLNRPTAGGRPTDVDLDDVIPTEAIDSPTVRQRTVSRFLSMILPMGRAGCRIRVFGTPMHREDLIGMFMTGAIGGATITPEEHRRAYDPATKRVMFRGRWTYNKLMELRENAYVRTGNLRLFKREIQCDLSEDQTHPLSNLVDTVPTFTLEQVRPLLPEIDSTLAIDNAKGGGGDNFVALLYWRHVTDNRFIRDATISNTMNVSQRLHEVMLYCRRFKPHRIVCQKNTESSDFIETLEEFLRRNRIWTKIIPAPVSTRPGAKNNRIYSRLFPVFDDRRVHFLENGRYNAHARLEMSNFDMTGHNNLDDFLDTLALAEEHSAVPDIADPEYDSGNPAINSAIKQIMREEAEAKKPKRKNKNRFPAWV